VDIYSFRHKGLRQFFEKGQTKGLPQDRVEKLRRIFSALNEAESVAEMDSLPGWRLHQLRGDRLGTWSVSVSGNWRITFRVEEDRIYDVNLEDYH
jgi:proteic killer suppression protein|tara:strand:+ start:573 stop:857 length:285 start_codon:yes stop_codon:yes gene_type:complete